MRNKICPSCGSKMKKNGKTRAGRQRWRCTACNASATHKNNVSQREFKRFLKWLLSKDRQLDMEGQGRSFRRHTSRFWDIWPMPEAVDEVHRAIFVDGIYLSRNVVVLIACSEDVFSQVIFDKICSLISTLSADMRTRRFLAA